MNFPFLPCLIQADSQNCERAPQCGQFDIGRALVVAILVAALLVVLEQDS
jgi:hypothetical protein